MKNRWLMNMQRLRLVIMILCGLVEARVARAAPRLALDPTSLAFELLAGGSDTRQYSVTNAGKGQLVVRDMHITGPDADQFHFDGAVDPSCRCGQDCAFNFRLAPGASRSFGIACAPNHPGFFTATLTVESNAHVGDRTIDLACTGDAPASMSTLVFTPALIDFGISFAEPPFPTALDRTLRVTNTAAAPSQPVEFQVLVPGTTGNGSFSLPAGEFGFLGPGESQDLTIRFQWSGGVLSTAPLVLQSIDPSQPTIQVPMFAEAAYGDLVFDDPPLSNTGFILMPAVAAGETSTLTLRGHNAGDFELGISDASAFAFFGGTAELLGPTSNAFLARGESAEWTLTCTPDGSEGAEEGASGLVTFNYYTAASDFDSFSLFCPIVSAPLGSSASQLRRGPTRGEIGTDSAAEGGCSAAHPMNLAPLGVLALALLVPVRRHRWSRRPRTRSDASTS